MRTEIEKQQIKKIIVHFSGQEREKKERKKKKLIIGDNLTIISLHAPHHVEESTPAHLGRRQIARFDHRAASHAPSTRQCMWNTS